MGITKPYYRIYRPGAGSDYLNDLRYCSGANEMYRSFQLLELDLKRIFEFIEPTDDNLSVYSHRLYELLLRACTEFEASAKAILIVNGYSKKNGNFNIEDYFLLDKATKLSEYKITLNIWNSISKEMQPFIKWADIHSLDWYSDYNTVKHNRFGEFRKASLNNVINSIAGVYAILYSQIGNMAITGTPQKNRTELSICDKNGNESPVFNNSIFTIESPKWDENDKYDFNWESLKHNPEPFTKFIFEH